MAKNQLCRLLSTILIFVALNHSTEAASATTTENDFVKYFVTTTRCKLFRCDYSIYPILKTTAFCDLSETPDATVCASLADLKGDSNYWGHFKAESEAAKVFCELIMQGKIEGFGAPTECDNLKRRRDVLFGYNNIIVRINYLNAKTTSAKISWKYYTKDKAKPALNEVQAEEVVAEKFKEAAELRDSFIGKAKAEICKTEGQPLAELGFIDLWDNRKDITANWIYFTKPGFPMRLAFEDETCIDACILNQEQQDDFFKWRLCQFGPSKIVNLPDNLKHCVLPKGAPTGKSVKEVIAIYGTPWSIETVGKTTKLIYKMHPTAWRELTFIDDKCDEHVGGMVETGGLSGRDMNN